MQIRRATVRILLGTVANAMLAVVCFRLRLNLATVTLLFVLSVVVQALRMTFIGSVIAALIAAGFVDYFFISPVFTWRITNVFDIFALSAFVATAVLTSHLASSARREAESAERRSRTLDQLYLGSQKLLSLDIRDGVTAETLRVVSEIFGLRAACFFDGTTSELVLAGVSESLPSKTREAYIQGKDDNSGERETIALCIRSAAHVTGAIGFDGIHEARLAARPLVALVAATIDRARAMQAVATASAEAKAEVFRTAILDGLAHEFKTPLAVIVAASGGLQESGNLTSLQRDLAAEIEKEAVRLGELTSSLLGRNDADYEQLEPRLTKRDLGVLIGSMVERFACNHSKRQIRFVQEDRHPVYAGADDELLGMVVNQLLDNAVKYSEPESPIEVSLAQSRVRTEIRFCNRGSIIPAAEQEMIFQRFYRGARQQHIAPGSGLGLYVARKIAIAHGGTLTVDTRAARDEGVTILMTLPLTEEEIQYAGITTQSAGCR